MKVTAKSKIIKTPYRSRYSATTESPKDKSIELISERCRAVFHAPCDKIYAKGLGLLDLTDFIKYKSTVPIGFKRGYGGLDNSHRFIIIEAEIIVFQNRSGYEIQFNPSQFRSYRYMDLVLRALLKWHYHEAKIFKTHLFVDIRKQIQDVYESITVRCKRRTTKYTPAKYKVAKSGRIESTSFTLGIGDEKTDCIKIYNSTTKHGLPDPSTRIERQFSKAKFCPVNSIEDFPRLLGINPFINVSLYSILDTSKLIGINLLRYKLLDCKRHRIGLHETVAELRKDNPKHFNRDYRKVMALLERTKVNLYLSYRNKMSGFLKRPFSKAEIASLKDLGVSL